MARCEGKTRSGDRCKREAREGSKFCYLHGEPVEETATESTESTESAEALEFEDFLPLLLAGAATIGFMLVFKSLGRFIPRF